MKTLSVRALFAVLFMMFSMYSTCKGAESVSLADLVRIDMSKSKVETVMKRGGGTRSFSMPRPKDGWEAKGSPNTTVSTYAKNAEDRLNIYIEYAETYTIKVTPTGKEELFLFYDGDERVQFMLVLETKK